MKIAFPKNILFLPLIILFSALFTPSVLAQGADYLIVCDKQFKPAADTLAAWRKKTGLISKVATTEETGTTTDAIKAYVQNAYDTWDPAPAYLLIIGDTQFVPTNYMADQVATDLYYATLDGQDYFPDLAYGRISIVTPEQAVKRVNDIIDYETKKINDDSFYTTAACVSTYLDEDHDNLDDLRALTSEEVAIFLQNRKNYSLKRIYYCDPALTPQTWKTIFPIYMGNDTGPAGSMNGTIPDFLKKPQFAWDGKNTDIQSAINSGCSLLTYVSGHGSTMGLISLPYSTSDVVNLTNGNKLPMIWSMTCLTGAFDLIHTPNGMDPPGTPADTCFSEALERNPHGGAIGIVASSRVAVTFDCGFLTWGLMNYLWPEYSEYTLYPRPETPRGMGDALNYAKLYGKSRLWNGGNITFEEWHWFGDPATRFWTGVPKNLKVSQPDSLKINTNENITISVTDEQNNPIEEAMVTISTVNAPSDYWRATTDASGNAVFSLIITQSDDYDIVVTKSEFLSYQGTVYSSGVNYNKIFVDKANSGTADGSPEHPLSKVSQGVTQVNSYGTVAIKTGVYGAGENKPLRINKAMKLQAVGGPVTIKPS